MARFSLGLQVRAVVEQEFGRLAPRGNIGDVVLERLKLSDNFTESLALFHIGKSILQYAVQHTGAECRHHDAFVVERRQEHVPSPTRLSQDEFVRHEYLIEVNHAGSHRAHAKFWKRRDFDSRRLCRYPKERDALMPLRDFFVGTREEQ